MTKAFPCDVEIHLGPQTDVMNRSNTNVQNPDDAEGNFKMLVSVPYADGNAIDRNKARPSMMSKKGGSSL